jgi:hypothetical protein
MRRSRFLQFAIAIVLMTPLAWAADPLIGNWRLTSQEVAGNQTNSNPLTLAITSSNQLLNFAYIVTVNDAPVVNLKFSTALDGTEVEVSGGDGKKMGTAKVSRDGAAYKVLIEGPGRPAVTISMTVSPDGKTLVSESDAQTGTGGNIHTKQVFIRQ